MNYVTIKNGVASLIERKQLYYAFKPPLVIINETNIEDGINKTIHIDDYSLEQVEKYKYLHIKLIAYTNDLILITSENVADIYKNDNYLARIIFYMNEYTNLLDMIFSDTIDITGKTQIIEKTFINNGEQYIAVDDSWTLYKEDIETIISTGDFKIRNRFITNDNKKAGFSTFQIYFSNNINPTF